MVEVEPRDLMKTEAQTETIWSKAKPTQPGKYLTRHAGQTNAVVVTRRGRGLSVFCAAYNDRVPMSIIGNGELEWAAIKE